MKKLIIILLILFLFQTTAFAYRGDNHNSHRSHEYRYHDRKHHHRHHDYKHNHRRTRIEDGYYYRYFHNNDRSNKSYRR